MRVCVTNKSNSPTAFSTRSSRHRMVAATQASRRSDSKKTSRARSLLHSSTVAFLSSRNCLFKLPVSAAANLSTSASGRCATATRASTTRAKVTPSSREHEVDASVSAVSKSSIRWVLIGNSRRTVSQAARSASASIAASAASAFKSRAARTAFSFFCSFAAVTWALASGTFPTSSSSSFTCSPTVDPSSPGRRVETCSPLMTSGAKLSMICAIFASLFSMFALNAVTSDFVSVANTWVTTRSRSVSHAVTALLCRPARLCFIAATPSRRFKTPLPPGPSSPSARTSAAPSPNSVKGRALDGSFLSLRPIW
mmetsp:Transcript_6613/g.22288  ORF Transcript_6613/g.22288 Transcript_6613/m.22288 type:complete len:311 (-) Transcript_6613:340-1272(-)